MVHPPEERVSVVRVCGRVPFPTRTEGLYGHLTRLSGYKRDFDERIFITTRPTEGHGDGCPIRVRQIESAHRTTKVANARTFGVGGGTYDVRKWYPYNHPWVCVIGEQVEVMTHVS